MASKSCFDCQNSIIMEDHSVGIWAHLEDCKQADKPEVAKVFESDDVIEEEKVAEQCPYFDPFLIAECCNCHKPINKPAYDYPRSLIVQGAWDGLPVCSDTCKVELQAKVDKEIAALKEHD